MKRTRPADEESGGAPIPPLARLRAPFVRRAIAASVKSAVQALVLEVMFPGGAPVGRYLGERPELPGPQPVSLNRRNLATVASHAYGVCEKSDGERAMLLLVRSPAGARGSAPVPVGAYLIDRTFDVVTFDGAEAYAAMPSGGPTLLEGELLLRRTDMGTGTGALAVFNMFDCVLAAGADVAGRPLKDRLEALRRVGREPYLELERSATAAADALLPPLYMIGKVIVSKSDVRGVLEKITHFEEAASGASAGGGSAAESVALLESELAAEGAPTCHRLYRGDKTRVNATDGLILTPSDASYRDLFSSADALRPLLKWKFPDENTIDFRIQLSDLDKVASSGTVIGGGRRPSVLLYVSTGRSEQDVCALSLSPAQAQAYVKIADRLHVDSVIVECAFVPSRGEWEIRRVRDKKTRANHIKTAWSTLEALAENISEADLIRALEKRA